MEKKKLRMTVENGLHGSERLKLLRNVVMVLTYDGQNKRQLEDDVIYAKDNFGGIGFWTQPFVAGATASADESASPANVLRKDYLGAVDREAEFKYAPCQFICPNKWAFRLSWDIFMLALVASAVLYFSSCEWRKKINIHFLYFLAGVVVPTVLLSLALLFCDPFWTDVSKGNSLLIFVIMAVLGYSIWNYYDKKRMVNLP